MQDLIWEMSTTNSDGRDIPHKRALRKDHESMQDDLLGAVESIPRERLTPVNISIVPGGAIDPEQSRCCVKWASGCTLTVTPSMAVTREPNSAKARSMLTG